MNNEIKLVKQIGVKEAEKLIDDAECFRVYLSGDLWDQPSLILRDDLKQIVDAFNLVDRFGGLEKAKEYVDNFLLPELTRAIALVEQCQ